MPRLVKHVLLPRHSYFGRYLRRVRNAVRDRHRHAPPYSPEELLARVDEFNRSAERYWSESAADPTGREALLSKPWATIADASSILYRTGVVLSALRVGVGQTVLDLGAGTCWLSAFLNRLGCRTIAIDVSPTALALGRELFALEPRQRRHLEPQFLSYDGRRFPIADGSVDRVVCFDAFHHVPNADEILGEVFRVLRTGGRAVFAEPGEGHSHTSQSRLEAERFQVLENELDLAEVGRTAKRIGFTDLLIKPYPDPEAITLTDQEFFSFMDGRDRFFPLDELRRSLREFHVFVLTKGAETVDSRQPAVLRAEISFREGASTVAGRAGSGATMHAIVRNTGDTVWLNQELPAGGYVRLGAHLLSEDRRPIDWDYLRAWLPGPVMPGESMHLDVPLQLPETNGRYLLRFDMVDEGIAWFEQRGSPVTDVTLAVGAS